MTPSRISREQVLQMLKTNELQESPWPMEEINDQDFSDWFDMEAKDFYRQTQAILKYLDKNGQ